MPAALCCEEVSFGRPDATGAPGNQSPTPGQRRAKKLVVNGLCMLGRERLLSTVAYPSTSAAGEFGERQSTASPNSALVVCLLSRI